MLNLLSVGEEVTPTEIVKAYEPWLEAALLPALRAAYGLIDTQTAKEECKKLDKLCDYATAAVEGDRDAAKRLKEGLLEYLRERSSGGLLQEAVSFLEGVNGRSLVEALAPRSSRARFALMLRAASGGRAEAVRLHGLLGSAAFRKPLPRRLLRDVYEKCGELQSEGCRLALLKLYYLHF